MQGYFKKPNETALTLTDTGWLRTGDRGSITRNGFLQITGRIKEQFKNSFGEYVSPSKLEMQLEKDPWINRAMVVGSGRPSTGALILPDFEALEEWCIENKVHWTAPIYMVHNPVVKAEFEKRVAQFNKKYSVHEHIQRFILLHEPWTIDSGLLTPALKLRREEFVKRFHKAIEEMYES